MQIAAEIDAWNALLDSMSKIATSLEQIKDELHTMNSLNANGMQGICTKPAIDEALKK